MQKYMVWAVVLSMGVCVQRATAMSDGVAAVAMSATVESLVLGNEQESDLNAPDADGNMQLHTAVANGDVAAVECLLGMKADPNAIDAHGRSPFFYACTRESSEDPQELATQDALIRMLYPVSGDDGILTADKLSFDVIKSIYGADHGFREYKSTFGAEREGILKLDDVLGTQPNELTSALPAACIGIVKEYIGGADAFEEHPLKARLRRDLNVSNDPEKQVELVLDICDTLGEEALLLALYMDLEVNGGSEKFLGATPLHCAVVTDKIAMARLLVEHKANVDARTNFGATPLHLAAQQGALACMKLLLAHGATVDACPEGKCNETPLYLATDAHQEEAVRLLLEHKADPNLFSAVAASDQETTACLLSELRANAERGNVYGRTPTKKQQKARGEKRSCVVS